MRQEGRICAGRKGAYHGRVFIQQQSARQHDRIPNFGLMLRRLKVIQNLRENGLLDIAVPLYSLLF
jgi:hypothetical protein